MTIASPRWKWSACARGKRLIVISPSPGPSATASGIRASACSKVKVRNCKGLSLSGFFLGVMAFDMARSREGVESRPFLSRWNARPTAQEIGLGLAQDQIAEREHYGQ